MPKPLNVLILEDNPADAELLLIELRRVGFEPVWQLVDNKKDFTASLKPELDLILSDYSLPKFRGLQALQLRNESGYDIPFILVSGAIGEEIAVECMREGAADYLFKDRLGRLEMAVANAIKGKRLRDQRRQAEQTLWGSEEHQKTIFETTSMATIVIEEDTTISMANKEFENLSGYSKEELEGKKSWTEFVVAEDLKRMQEYHRQRRIDQEKTIKSYEFRFINKQGGLRDILLRVDMIPGTKVSVASLLDITERKRTLAKLKRRTEDLGLINAINNAINRGESQKDILRILSEQTRQIFNNQSATVYLLSEDKKKLIMQETYLPSAIEKQIKNLIGMKIPPIKLTLEPGSLYQQVLLDGKPRLFYDPAEIQTILNEFVAAAPFSEKVRAGIKTLVPQIQKILKMRSVFIVPLLMADKAIGVMDISSRRMLTEFDIERLNTIAQQITTAIMRIQAHTEIKRLGYQNQLILNSVGEGILGIGINGEHIFVNHSAAEMLGYEVEELIGLESHSIWHHTKPDGSTFLKDECPNYKTGKTGVEYFINDDIFWKKDGTSFNVQYSSTPIYEKKKIVGSVVTFRDITERKQAEIKLRESEKKYQSLFKNIPVGIYRSTPDGEMLAVNPALVRMLGYGSEDELIKINIHDLYVDPANREDILKTISKSGGTVNKEMRLKRKDGQQIVVLDNVSVIHDAQGEILCFEGTLTDITERKRAEEKRQESEEKLRNIVEHSTNMFYSHTPDHILTYVSPQSKRLLGYEPEEMLIKWQELTTDDPVNQQGFMITQEAINTGIPQPPYELELIAKNGNRIWVETREAPVVRDGKTIAIVGSLTDITKRRQAQQEIETLLDLSRQSGSVTNLDDLLFSIADRIVEVIPPAEAASIHLYDKEREVIKIQAWSGFKDGEIKGIEFKVDDSLGGRILRTRKPALINNVSEDPDYKLVDRPGIKIIKSQIAVPLVYKKSVIGIAYADNRTRTDAFSPNDLEFLESIGNQLAGTIENARLLDQVREDQKRLSKSEEQYRLLAENSIDCIWLLDTKLRFTYISPSSEIILGYKPEQMVGTKLSSHFKKREYLKAGALAAKAMANYKTFPQVTFETKMLNSKNEEVDLEISGKALVNDQGKLIGLQGTTTDITERVRAREKDQRNIQNIMFLTETAMSFVDFPPGEDIYRFTGEKLRKLVGESIVVINSVDSEKGKLTTRAVSGIDKYSKELIKLIGRDPVGIEYDANDEKLAYLRDGDLHAYEKGLYGIFLDTVPKPVCRALEKIYRLNKIYTMGFVKNDILFGNLAIFLPGGAELESRETIESFVKQASIAIQRKQAEQALHREQEKAQKYLDIAEVIMLALNSEGEVTLINQKGSQVLGYQEGELQGRNWFDTCLPDENRKEVKQVFKKIMAGGDELVDYYENLVLTKSGEQRFIAWHSTNLWDEKGNLIGTLSSGEDITERVRVEKLLKALNQAGTGMGKALKRTEIFNVIADQLKQLDIFCMLFPLDESKGRLSVRYLSYESALLTKAEKLVGVKHKDFSFPVDAIDTYREVVREKKALFVDNPEQVVRQILPKFVKELSAQIVKSLRIQRSISAPLIVEGRVIGAFSVQSDDLTPADIPIITAFADQLAGAWNKVELMGNLKKSLDGTIRAIAATVEVRDSYTAGHQERVSDLAAAIAIQMGLAATQVEGIKMAGIIHDLGKINVPAEILSKPGKLTELEFELIKIHPQVGYDLLEGIEFPWPLPQMVLQHHEKMDGSGYPQGLKGEEILLEARILGVADIVEAMSTHRPYRPALGLEKALAQIRKDRGTLLDSEVVDACLKVFEQGYKLVEIEGMFKVS